MRVTEKMKKLLSILLCLCMLVQNCPVMAFAATTDNLCDHHTKHTAECGYREGSTGSACTHEHSEDCYEILNCLHECGTECEQGCNHECTVENGCITMELDCHHVHGDCGYSEGISEVPCGHVHNESCGYAEAVAGNPCANAETDPECNHSGDCGYVAAVEGQPCGHTACDDTCGYAPATEGTPCNHSHAVKVDSADSCYKLLCSHADGGHDDACGYAAAVEAQECHYECAECAAAAASEEPSEESSDPAPICDCGTDDPAIHATTCPVYAAPENLVCYCAMKCTEANIWCDVCGFDYSKCTGTDTAAAYADGDDLYISNVNMSSTPYLASGSTTASATKPETGGYAYWDAASNTITLNNFTSATDAATGIFYRGSAVTLRIVLVGNNSVTGGNGGSTEVKSGVGVNSDTDIIFSGGGTLTATGTGTGTGNGGGYGVFAWGDITVDSGTTLIATGSSFLSGVHAEGGSIIVNAGGSLTGNGGESGGHGVCADTGITVNGGSLTGNSKVSYGVYADSITVSGDSHIVANGGDGNRIPVGNLPEDYYYYASGDGTDKTFTHSTDAPLTGTVTETYFELVTAQHLSDTYTSNGDATHSRYCSCALHTKVTAPEACSGGTATCTEQAECQHCGASYGAVDTTNHDSSVECVNGFCPNGCYEPAVLNGDVYEISNAGQLFWFAQQVNSGKADINGKLMGSIVVNEGTMTESSTGVRAWTPIGNDSNQYTGNFNGNGKTVSGLYFNDNTINDVGLFGYVGSGTVQNVGIVKSYFHGNTNVGGVVGSINSGTIIDCYNSGTVSGTENVGGVVGAGIGSVTGCYNSGTVTGTGRAVGGVMGRCVNNSTVTDCYNTGTVTGGIDSGGVVGHVSKIISAGTVTNCYNSGPVTGTDYVGGVVGGSGGTITGCYNSSTVTGTGRAVGGVVGGGGGTVTGCYNTGSVTGTDYVGGVAGENNGTVTNCYYDKTVYSGNAIGGNSGTATDVEGKSTAQFASGEVAYLLGSPFGQNIGTDAAPNFTGGTVYQVTNCKGDTAYSNTNESIDHNWVGGTCTVCKEVCTHTGGTATCKDKAVCTVCGESYGELDANNHTPGENADYTDNGDGTHSYTCTVCGTTVTEAHTYVDGTCACGLVKTYTITFNPYGDSGAKIVEINGEAKEILHGGTFTVPHGKELKVKFENTLSKWETGVYCDGYVFIDQNLIMCNYNEATNTLTIPGNKVTGDFVIGVDAYVRVQFNLHGGTLTDDGRELLVERFGYTWDAETSTLKAGYSFNFALRPEYFQLAGHTLAGAKVDGSEEVVQQLKIRSDMTVDILWECDGTAILTPVPAKDATCMEAGNIAHYVCTCGKLYEDEAGTKELTAEEVKTDIDPTNHVGVDTATGKCACDYQFGFYVERDIEIDGIYHETYWFDNLSDALSYAHGSTDFGQYTTQSATVRLHRDLTIEEGEIFSFQKQVVLDTNSFSVTNHGTLALEGYTYSTIPAAITGGTVKIGEKSYTWDSENNKWICAEGSHVTELEENKATCTTQAVCDLCGTSYGAVDKTNHASDTYTYTDNSDGTHSAVYPCCGTKGQPENHTLTYTTNGSTITESCSANCGYSANLTLKAPANLVYDRTEKAATVEGEIIADYELTYSADAVIMAGDYTATLTVGDYSVSLAFTIAKADPDVVTPSDLKATYGQTLADVELPGGWAWKNSSASVGSVGSNTFAAIYTPANISNFNTLERDLTVVVAKAMPTVTAPVAADDLVYNGTAQTLITAGTATGGTMQYSLDGSIWSETIPTGKDAKTYTVYYKVVGDSNHNDSSVDSVQVTIGKATLTVTADNKTMTTGQNLPTFTYTVTGFVNGETEDMLTTKPTVSCEANGQTAGTYDITVSGAAADNYEITHVNGALSVVDHQHAWTYTAKDDTITATCNAEGCPDAEQSITISVAGKTYDGKPVTAELEGSIDGVADPEIIYSGNTNAGTYTASITQGKATATVEFTIEKATVTVTADAKSKPYGTDNPTLTYTSEGLLGDDALTGALETTATKTSSVGEYNITVGSLANSNYTIRFVGAKLTITKAAAPEIQWPNAAALTYGQKLSDSALTSEDKNGTFAWQDGSIVPTVKNNGYVVVYTPKDTANYDYTGVELTETIPVTVSKAASSIVTAPKANTLTYTGEAQELITAGEAKGGTMQYQLNGGAWSASIPTAKDEGAYTVSWKVVGDANHADTEVKSITVTIGDCTHSGNTNKDDADCTTQVTCSVCGDVLLESKAHVWGDWTITKNPTTTEEGSRERLCTNDGCEAKDTGSIPMLNEVEVPEEIVGGDIEVSNPTPATGDDVTITVTPDTGKEVDEVIVTGKDGKEIPVTDNGDGTYTYEQPDGDVTVEVVIKDTIYTVTWIVDGKTYKETQHKYGETITAPTDPIKAQSGCTTYTFDKWNGFTSGMTMPDNESLAFTAVFTEGESHIDENTDHICDRNCGKTDIEDHADPSGDNDHVCDYCRQPVNECSDVATDKDHLCDECGAAMPKVGTEVMFSEEDTTGTITPGAPAEIDGKPIVIDWDGEIWLEDKDSKFLVTYKFNEDADPHKEYPTAMYAWLLKWEGETCKAIRVPELDNFMTYKGTSIRINHSSDGIRFFTAVPVDTLNQAMKGTLLTGELEGYKLVEMGTLYKWAAIGTELTVANGAKSYVYGGSAGSTYRQFSKEGSLSWFTGMLTDLPGDAATLAKDILSRPYAVFENADGDQITLYGGSIQRSIYYVALQNKDTWASGTAYDNYVEKIIATVEAAND